MAKKDENKLKEEILSEVKQKVTNEVNKEIKKTIIDNVQEYKEELRNEIHNEITNEVMNAVKREEKRILRSKNFSIFKKNIVILILVGIVCYFAYCLYDAKYFDFMKNDCEQVNSYVDNNSEKEEVIKDKEWYIENNGYLLSDIKVNLNTDLVSSYYLYSKNFNVDEIKTSYLLNMSYKKLDSKDIKTTSKNITIKASVLKNTYQELFGNVDNYENNNFTYDCLNFIYDEAKDNYVAENNKCTESNREILEVITDMYEKDNKLYVETIATIYDKNEGSYYNFDDLYEPVVTNVTEEDLETLDNLNKYQYIFNKVEDNYYLNSINKLK